MTASVHVRACNEKKVRITKTEPNVRHSQCKLETTIVKEGSDAVVFLWGNQVITIEEIE